MQDDSSISGVLSEAQTHPAVKAWRALQPSEPLEPRTIEMLEKGRKTNVYRLDGFGQPQRTLIAKRCRRATSVVERTVYQDCLPQVPGRMLRYHGFAPDDDDAYCWLFLEDAGGERYSSANDSHRALAGHWLALLHLSVCDGPVVRDLPARTPAHYLEELQSSETVIRDNLVNPALSADDVAVLNAMLSSYGNLRARWARVEALCRRLPETLVHGDFAEKNLRVRRREGEDVLLVFDWETAGWGTPAVDLAQFALDSGSPSLESYLSAVESRWVHLTIGDLEQLANVGVIFRMIYSIAWEQAGIVYSRWASRGLAEKCAKWTMVEFRNYHARLEAAMQRVDWQGPRA